MWWLRYLVVKRHEPILTLIQNGTETTCRGGPHELNLFGHCSKESRRSYHRNEQVGTRESFRLDCTEGGVHRLLSNCLELYLTYGVQCMYRSVPATRNQRVIHERLTKIKLGQMYLPIRISGFCKSKLVQTLQTTDKDHR